MKQIVTISDVMSISELCKEILPLPKNAVLLGMAHDKPVLIDVYNAKNIIIWDKAEGQGILVLKTAIEYIVKYKLGNRVEFLVVSNRTKDWEKLSENELGVWNENECVAVVPFWHIVADQVFKALAEWSKKSKTRIPVILFVDGIENVDRMSEESVVAFKEILAWGSKNNIYVIATSHSSNNGWESYFCVDIFGTSPIHWFETNKVLFYAPKTEI